MAKYEIELEQFIGMSHSGCESTDGYGTVELSDEEVQALVSLIREKNTTDVDELELRERYPAIYDKLEDACRTIAYEAEETYWLYVGYKDGAFDYDTDELMDYCEENCGFKFEYDPDDYLDDDDELDEDWLSDDKSDAFDEWLNEYVDGLSTEEMKSFFYEHMNPGLDLDNVEYEIVIPDEIIAMSSEK